MERGWADSPADHGPSVGLSNPGTTVIDVDRIVTDPATMGGVPCIAGTTIPVTTILELLWEGVTPAEILGHYPQLVLADIHACMQSTQTANEPGLDER